MTVPFDHGTRGPHGAASRSSVAARHFAADDGPLVPGPLGPLVPGGRLDLLLLATVLEHRWGADLDTGGMACPLPGHTGTARLGTPPGDLDDDLRLLCNCRARWRSLGEVRAAEAYGTDAMRSNIELAVWVRRLAHEVGGFAPVDVRLPVLPEDAPSTALRARDGFALLVGLRWADYEPRPVAFSVRFCRAWCGLESHRAAHEAIRHLIEHAVIVEDGRVGRVRLFRPGRIVLREVPPLPPDRAGDDAVIAALIEAFDATEEPAT